MVIVASWKNLYVIRCSGKNKEEIPVSLSASIVYEGGKGACLSGHLHVS